MKASQSRKASPAPKASKARPASQAPRTLPASKSSPASKASRAPKDARTPTAPKSPERYHPLLVTIHWITAVLIVGMLLFGTFWLKRVPNDAEKNPLFVIHILVGLIILALTIVRLVVRFVTKLPAPATAGNRILDAVGVAVHWLLYLGALGMGVSGLVLALQAGMFPAVFLGRGEVPIDLYVYTPRISHGFISMILYVIIALHIGAALYHEIIRKDRLLGRMWFGKATGKAK